MQRYASPEAASPPALDGAALHKLLSLTHMVSEDGQARFIRSHPWLARYFSRLSILARQLAPVWQPSANVRTEAEAFRMYCCALADFDRLCRLDTDTVIVNAVGPASVYDLVRHHLQGGDIADLLPQPIGPEPSMN